MSKHVPFHITAGLPFGRSIAVTLPDDRDWWLDLTELEVLSQIRMAPDYRSTLVLDLTKYLTITFDEPDTVLIDLRMSGAATRRLSTSGYYDFVMSDPFTEDDYAIRFLEGPVYRDAVITADKEAVL